MLDTELLRLENCAKYLSVITSNDAKQKLRHLCAYCTLADWWFCLVTTQTLSSTHTRARASLRGGGRDNGKQASSVVFCFGPFCSAEL